MYLKRWPKVKVKVSVREVNFIKCCMCGKEIDQSQEGIELEIFLFEELPHEAFKQVTTFINRQVFYFCRSCYWKNFSIE